MIRYIGPPGLATSYQILRSCVLELIRAGVILSDSTLFSFEEAAAVSAARECSASSKLLSISQLCCDFGRVSALKAGDVLQDGAIFRPPLSGRSLRRMPVLAYSRCVLGTGPCSLDELLCALREVAIDQIKESNLQASSTN